MKLGSSCFERNVFTNQFDHGCEFDLNDLSEFFEVDQVYDKKQKK